MEGNGHVETEPANARLGARLKGLRKQRGYTLAVVAENVGLSVSFLSLLENNKTDVSLARLQRIARFYGTNVSDLFAPEREVIHRVVHLADAMRVASPADGCTVIGLAEDPERTLEPYYAIMEPGAGYFEPIVHAGDEFVHVLRGHIRVQLGEEMYDLHPGDTIHHRSDIPHTYVNVGNIQATMIGCSRHVPLPQGNHRVDLD